MMTQEEFITHACEQVLRFTQVEKWNNLSEEVKVQLGFNMGVIALGLNLSKEDGFGSLSSARQGKISMNEFNKHLKNIVNSRDIKIDEKNISRPF